METIIIGKKLNDDNISAFNSYKGYDKSTDIIIKKIAREFTKPTETNEITLTKNSTEAIQNIDNTANIYNEDRDDGAELDSKRSNLQLLRILTSMSQIPGVVPISENIDPRLDPLSDEFNTKFWIKNMRKLVDSDPNYYRPTSLGFVAKNLISRGISSDADFQENFLNYPFKIMRNLYLQYLRGNDYSRYFDILKSMDCLINPGSLTVVLGRPGAGCSTFLKTVAAQTYGFKVDKNSVISYNGMSPKEIIDHYRGDVIFSAEMDHHFSNLTVGQTLEFASFLRTPQNRFPGTSRKDYATHMAQVFMAMYGLSHTINTKVGNDYIRGISGGERKRVSIAEASLCGAKIQCWDNATRGLDAATALEFVKSLKTSARVLDITPLIAIYQCSEDAYNLFDNVVLLYEGYQIYFGLATKAKAFFENMGYECPERQTTADFLTSITSPAERIVKKGFENKIPKTPEEFEAYWKKSPEYAKLIYNIDENLEKSKTIDTSSLYKEAHIKMQSNHTRPSSSFRVSYTMQVKSICMRNYYKVRNDPSIMLFSTIANIIMGLIISSLFYNLQPNTSTFYYRTAAMFFAVLFNAFSSLLELTTLAESRPIVEKHKKFALYHPSADALASIITEIPSKLLICLGFNLIYYFMVNFRRDPGRFFFYLMMNFMATLVMSHIFRSVGSSFKTLEESMPLATVILTAMIIYTGFALPTPTMHGWSRWINYINPVAYAFEALLTNEFDGRKFDCSIFIPPYPNANLANQVCTVVSAKPGYSYINGTDYIFESYKYSNDHKWRNVGIVIGFIIFFLFVYLVLVEVNKGAMQKGEIILFQQSTLRKMKNKKLILNSHFDEEANINFKEKLPGVYDHNNELSSFSSDNFNKLASGTEIFHWKDVCYEVKIKDETRSILNHVDGWVKPGTLTALMGVSGAGKTTLLDVLANRVTTGVVAGSMFINGRLRDQSFQRSTGYVQQQDLHLPTSTVREALRFSAYLRQPRTVTIEDKNKYVESIIDILEMAPYSDAIVGVIGEGLNVEQRKRLTIGVELAAKPKLLLFLDEPTSGLESQSAWSICQLMRKLADHGQAILCTIHQPSAILLKEFDRLLFLEAGGRTVYFGDLGENCQTLIDYFESHGSSPCPKKANPAEWMLEVIGAAPGSHAIQDYNEVWMASDERKAVRNELELMEINLLEKPTDNSIEGNRIYASSYYSQYIYVTKRVFQQYWRTPKYIWSKLFLSIANSIFNGFSFFKAGTSLQGLQNQMLSVFMFSIMLNSLIQQMLPLYISQRSIYEVRERPSKTFTWWIFLTAQITAEFPWNLICGTISYFCWYYPIGFYENAKVSNTVTERGVLSWLLIVGLFNYASTLGLASIAGIEQEQNGATVSNLLFTMCLNFCGILKYPTGFWSFMYRANPFTYWVASLLAAGVGDTKLVCSKKEIVYVLAPNNLTCQEYMTPYIDLYGGYLVDGKNGYCGFCTISDTNSYLESVHVKYYRRWRDWGIFICFIAINIISIFFLYWLIRVPKKTNNVKNDISSNTEETRHNNINLLQE